MSPAGTPCGSRADALDLNVAQELAAEAEKARAAGDRAQARALVTKALGLWDGEPLASVPGPYAQTQRARLEEWRLQLTETRLDLALECGQHAEAVSELTALTAAHPLRERLRELLMLALYRSGRQAEPSRCTRTRGGCSRTSWAWTPAPSCRGSRSGSCGPTTSWRGPWRSRHRWRRWRVPPSCPRRSLTSRGGPRSYGSWGSCWPPPRGR